jgi:hypothetical protein
MIIMIMITWRKVDWIIEWCETVFLMYKARKWNIYLRLSTVEYNCLSNRFQGRFHGHMYSF